MSTECNFCGSSECKAQVKTECDKIRDHVVPIDECDDVECSYCAIRDCPNDDAFHYHHDGCTSCCFDEQRNLPVKSQGLLDYISEENDEEKQYLGDSRFLS